MGALAKAAALENGALLENGATTEVVLGRFLKLSSAWSSSCLLWATFDETAGFEDDVGLGLGSFADSGAALEDGRAADT